MEIGVDRNFGEAVISLTLDEEDLLGVEALFGHRNTGYQIDAFGSLHSEHIP
jgi:hypothetical protein